MIGCLVLNSPVVAKSIGKNAHPPSITSLVKEMTHFSSPLLWTAMLYAFTIVSVPCTKKKKRKKKVFCLDFK